MARRNKSGEQPELPMDESGKPAGNKATHAGKNSSRTTESPGANANGNGNGNGGAHHIVAESEAAPLKSRPVKPTYIELPLHRRVDTGFMQYASYVIRDRAIPNL